MHRKISPVSRSFKLAASLAILAVLLVLAQPAAAKSCNRDCLRDFITQYLNAMVARNRGALPVAANVRFTENAAS
jgi:hypothetical protein